MSPYARCYLADGCEGDEACAALCPDRRRGGDMLASLLDPCVVCGHPDADHRDGIHCPPAETTNQEIRRQGG